MTSRQPFTASPVFRARGSLRVVALGFIFALVATPAVAQAPEITWALDDALEQIDRQADDFESVLARVEVRRITGENSEAERFSGNIFVDKRGYLRLAPDGGQRVILAEPNRVQVYDAQQAIVEQFAISQHRDRVEPWLRLGFSTTGKDLDNGFVVTALGEEMIRSHRTIVLEMTPKRNRDREAVRHVRIWIDQASWLPVRHEVARTQAGDRLVVDYSQMARNLRLNPALFRDDWPRGTKRVRR